MRKQSEGTGLPVNEKPWKSVGFKRKWPLGGSDYEEVAKKRLKKSIKPYNEARRFAVFSPRQRPKRPTKTWSKRMKFHPFFVCRKKGFSATAACGFSA